MRRFLAGMLMAVMVCAMASPHAGAAEVPPTGQCVKTVKGLIAELPDLEDASEAEYRKADRGFVNDLAASDCISDPKPLLGKVALKPGSARCQVALKAADEYWKPYTARFNVLDDEWKRIGAPMQRRVWHLQARIRQLREGGASTARINRVLRTRRSVGKRLHRYSNRLQHRTRLIFGPVRYESFLTLTELVALRCIDTNVFELPKGLGLASKVLAKNFEAVILPLIYLTEDPGGELAVNRYFESLHLD